MSCFSNAKQEGNLWLTEKGETFVGNDSEVDLGGNVHIELLHQELHMSRINRPDLISKQKNVKCNYA